MTRAVTTSDGFRVEFNPRGGMNYSLHGKPWPAPGRSEDLVILIESLAKEIGRLASPPSVALEARERAYEAARANLREAWAALAMLRETVETLAPSGAVKAVEHLDGPTFMHEADALIEGILALTLPQPEEK